MTLSPRNKALEKIKFVSLAANSLAMSTAELKLDIIEKVKSLSDEELLLAIADLLHSEEDVYILSEAQKRSIEKAQTEIRRRNDVCRHRTRCCRSDRIIVRLVQNIKPRCS